MRITKFKGKAKTPIKELDQLKIRHVNGWVVGNLIENKGNPYIVGNLVEATEEYINHEFWLEVIPETVAEYSGFKDVNNVDVFEGDICKYWMDGVWKTGYVIWYRGGFALRVTKMGERKTNEIFEFQCFIPAPRVGDIMEDQFQVVGNIYEDPDPLASNHCVGVKSREEIEKLKIDWQNDPIWDIEDTEGFEAHREELLAFRLAKEDGWENQRKEEDAKIDEEAERLGLRGLYRIILTMQLEIDRLIAESDSV